MILEKENVAPDALSLYFTGLNRPKDVAYTLVMIFGDDSRDMETLLNYQEPRKYTLRYVEKSLVGPQDKMLDRHPLDAIEFSSHFTTLFLETTYRPIFSHLSSTLFIFFIRQPATHLHRPSVREVERKLLRESTEGRKRKSRKSETEN